MSDVTTRDILEIEPLRRRKSDFHAASRGGPVLSIVSPSEPGAESRIAVDIVRAEALAGLHSVEIRRELVDAQTLLRRLWEAYAQCYISKKVIEGHASQRTLAHMNAQIQASPSEIELARAAMDEAVAYVSMARDNLESIRRHVESASREVSRLGVLAAISDSRGNSVTPEIVQDINKINLLI